MRYVTRDGTKLIIEPVSILKRSDAVEFLTKCEWVEPAILHIRDIVRGIDGKYILHCEDGPAMVREIDGSPRLECWRYFGVAHRDGGQWSDQEAGVVRSAWVYGKKISEEFAPRLSDHLRDAGVGVNGNG